MRALITLCLIGLMASWTASAADTVESINACMKANIPESLQVREFELTATDKAGGTRTLAGRLSARLDKGKLNAMMRITQPSDMRDAAYLVKESDAEGKDEEMYVYLPALQKVRRVTGGMKDSSLFGTDLSYSDVKQITYALSGNKLTLERTENLEGRPAWVLSMAPDPSGGARFDKVIAWIDQKSCMLMKADFQQAGAVRKRFASSAKYLAKSGPHWYITQGRIEDLQEKTSTLMRVTDLLSDKDLADRLFNPRAFYLGN
ncbi:MAG: outer rane lipoproteinsorting protein [Panacagrimonas sp.]|jgi:hypothetical protein|nr:outer membrane lipoprotein-sorting protein [Panacagrimonas sp.]MCC2657291.1 outer rane lipoproteinsorting protein [Panacagrimonas sp.]